MYRDSPRVVSTIAGDLAWGPFFSIPDFAGSRRPTLPVGAWGSLGWRFPRRLGGFVQGYPTAFSQRTSASCFNYTKAVSINLEREA